MQTIEQESYSSTIKCLLNTIDEETLSLILTDEPEYYRIIDNPSIFIKKVVLSSNGNMIRVMRDDIPEELKLIAVDNTPDSIVWIHNPSEAVIKKAIENEPLSIRHVKKQSKEMQRFAYDKDPGCFKYLRSPSEEICKEAIKKYSRNLGLIKKQSMDLIKFALDIDLNCYDYINIPNEEICQYIINNEKFSDSKDWVDRFVICKDLSPEFLHKLMDLCKTNRQKEKIIAHPNFLSTAEMLLKNINKENSEI